MIGNLLGIEISNGLSRKLKMENSELQRFAQSNQPKKALVK
jgi:hypothetical protein